MPRRKNTLFIQVFIAIAVVLCPPAAAAQDAMSWADCVAAAAKNNPSILSADSTFESDRYKAKAAYSGFLPQISGDVNYNSGSFSAGSSGSFTTDTYSASVTAQQNIFAGFHDKATVDQTAANREASRFSMENTKVQASYDLKSAFASLLYAQDSSKLQVDIIKRRDDNARLVNMRFEAGMENKGNALLANAFLGQARYDKLQADHSIEVARQQLAKVIGSEDAEKIKITGKIPIAEPKKDPDLISIALDTPQYRQVVAQERAAKAGVTLAKANFSPTLDFTATAERDGSGWPPGNTNSTYGFNLGVPIFNGANNYFTLKSSQASLSAAQFTRQNTELQLLPKLKEAYTNFIDAFEKLKVDRAFLEAAVVRADIATNKYKNGLLSFEDWDIIENDLITKQKNVLSSEENLYLTEAAWMQAQGKGVIP
jgi:outer membrane protein TolC